MPTDPLDPNLNEAAIDTHLLHRPQLEAIGSTVSRIDPDEFIAAVVFAPGLTWNDNQHRPHDYFEIHSRHWWIDASHADTGLHFELRRHPAPQLPPHHADTVNPDDYAEFVRAIERAEPSVPIPGDKGTI